MIEPGSYAKWQPKYIWPRVRIGRVVATDGPIIHLAVNGSTYEVDTRTEVVRAVRACERCGRPVQDARSIYCSRRCFAQTKKDLADECVFDVVVDFKRRHDGLSPKMDYLTERSGYSDQSVTDALKRLHEAGRIYYVGEGFYRQIAVTGGRWTYADPESNLAE